MRIKIPSFKRMMAGFRDSSDPGYYLLKKQDVLAWQELDKKMREELYYVVLNPQRESDKKGLPELGLPDAQAAIMRMDPGKEHYWDDTLLWKFEAREEIKLREGEKGMCFIYHNRECFVLPQSYDEGNILEGVDFGEPADAKAAFYTEGRTIKRLIKEDKNNRPVTIAASDERGNVYYAERDGYIFLRETRNGKEQGIDLNLRYPSMITSLHIADGMIITGHYNGSIYSFPIGEDIGKGGEDCLYVNEDNILARRDGEVRGIDTLEGKLVDGGMHNSIQMTDIVTKGTRVLRQFPPGYVCMDVRVTKPYGHAFEISRFKV